ncbi:MAG: hypothetical protein K2Q18_08105 [Bdellovibrionales bacterium]|nr:hypothetical protein [Bdellovibrionales bacterium]
MRPNFFQRKYLITGSGQLRVSLYLAVLYNIVLIAIYFMLKSSILDALVELSRITNLEEPISAFKQHLLMVIFFTFAIFGMIGNILLFLGNIIISNRIVGPIYRFHRILKTLNSNGQLEKLHIRENDFNHDFYKELIEYIRKKEEIER